MKISISVSTMIRVVLIKISNRSWGRQNNMNCSRNHKSAVDEQSRYLGHSGSILESSCSHPYGNCFDPLKIYVATSPWTGSET